MKKKMLVFAVLIMVFSFLSLQAGTRLELKLRVYQGARQGTAPPPDFVTTSYLQPTITANMELEMPYNLEKETAKIKRIFNLQDVSLLTEADLVIGEEKAGQSPDSVRHFFRLNGNAFEARVMLKEWTGVGRFLVLFNEMEAEKPKNVLTTEMILLGGHSAVFGFEDKNGKPYFCSFHVTGPSDKILPPPPPPPPPPPLSPEKLKEIKEFEKGAVKAKDTVNPPKLVKQVDPKYPPEAKEKGLDGFVVLNVRTDTQGNVSRVMVLKSTNEVFNQAAMDAIKQWKYEPFIQDGKPKDLVFSVNVKFQLR